jgi:hypothetical protein
MCLNIVFVVLMAVLRDFQAIIDIKVIPCKGVTLEVR